MQFGQSGVGGVQQPAAPNCAEFFSEASAGVGPSSAANYWSRTAAVDLTIGNTLVLLANYKAVSGDQTFWGCCRADRGWFIDVNNTSSLRIYQRGGSNVNYIIGPLSVGSCLAVAITCIADGSWRASFNGYPAILLSATPAYVANDGTSLETIGRCNAAVGTFACVQSDVIATAHVGAAASDAELVAWSGVVNGLNRHRMHAGVRVHASLVSELHFSRDWNGSTATATAGLGSTPAVYNKQGTGGAKTAYPSFRRYSFSEAVHLIDNSLWVSDPPGVRTSEFSQVELVTDATWVAVETFNRTCGVPLATDFGCAIDGTADVNGIEADGFDIARTYDRQAIAAGTHTINFVGGYQESKDGTNITGVRVPATASFSLSKPPCGARFLIVGDSMTGKIGGTGVQTPTTQGWVVIARANIKASVASGWTNGRCSIDAWGGRSWYDVINDSALMPGFVAQHVSMLDGTSKNVVWWILGINDYILNKYASLPTFETKLAAYLDAFNAAMPSGTICYLAYPVLKASETAIGGHTATDYRNSIGAVGATRAWLTVVNTTTFTDAADLYDGLHFSVAGSAKMAAAVKTTVGY